MFRIVGSGVWLICFDCCSGRYGWMDAFAIDWIEAGV